MQKIHSNFMLKENWNSINMPFPNKYNNKFNAQGAKTYEAAEGLDDFIKALEKYFFANAKLRCKQNRVEGKLDLVIDLHFNFGITDCLRHFNNGDWVNYSLSEESSFDMSLVVSGALNQLNEKSAYPADIMEISLHFLDTSIIITRLYQHSIPEQISAILTTIGKHFIYFTKGLTEMPYEVFVPVFEDTSIDNGHYNECGYFDYWGLYFDKKQEHEALIYSLDKKKLYEEGISLYE